MLFKLSQESKFNNALSSQGVAWLDHDLNELAKFVSVKDFVTKIQSHANVTIKALFGYVKGHSKGETEQWFEQWCIFDASKTKKEVKDTRLTMKKFCHDSKDPKKPNTIKSLASRKPTTISANDALCLVAIIGEPANRAKEYKVDEGSGLGKFPCYRVMKS